MLDDDEDLLNRARSGQTDALEKLLERHQAQIYRFGMKMCGDPEDAKDVLQDTLLSVARTAAGTCPDVLAMFSSHLEGQISAEVCAEMERHIEACPRCKGACDSLKRTLSLCHSLPAAPIPATVQASVKIALRNFLSGNA